MSRNKLQLGLLAAGLGTLAFVATLLLSGVFSTSDSVEGIGTPGANAIISTTFTVAIPPPIGAQHSECLAKVATDTSTNPDTVTLSGFCYNVGKLVPIATPPTPQIPTPAPPVPPPPPFQALDTIGGRIELSGDLNETTGAVQLAFVGGGCLPADSDNIGDVNDSVEPVIDAVAKDGTLGSGEVTLKFFLNNHLVTEPADCTGTPDFTETGPFTPTTLAANHDGDIDDPNVPGIKGPDGCTTDEELGDNEALGGLRDPFNPWDFYDPDGNGAVDLFNDIFGVAFLFGTSSPPATHDRGAPIVVPSPTFGGPWNLGPPDGVVDLFNDIFGVAFQFGHNCTAAP